MMHERAVKRYVEAVRLVRTLEAADPADIADLEYNLKQAKIAVSGAMRPMTGGDLAAAKRMLNAAPQGA